MAGAWWQRSFALVVSALFTASVAAIGVAAPVAADAPVHKYKLTFKTAELNGAATAARIYVVLYGDLGYSAEVMVKCGSACGTWSEGEENVVYVDDSAHVYQQPWPIGRIYKIQVYNDHHNSGADWKCDWVRVQHEVDGVASSISDSLFRFDKWFGDRQSGGGVSGPWVQTAMAESFPWIAEYGSGFVEQARGEIEHKDLLLSSVPSAFERQMTVSAGSEVGLAEGVTNTTQLTATIGYTPPQATGGFSAEFTAAIGTELSKSKEQSGNKTITETRTYKQTVPAKTLHLADLILAAEWETGILGTSAAFGARWYAGGKTNFDAASFQYGDVVPAGKWADYIRMNLAKYVPIAARGGTGPFTLTKPGVIARVIDDKAQAKQNLFRKAGKGWGVQMNGFRGRSYWTPVQANRVQRYATWRTQLAAPGKYGVYVYYPKQRATTRKAVYKITTKTGIKTRARNQKLTAGRWVKLGTFDFGWWGTVKLTDKTGERTASRRSVVFDAVKFVPVSPAVAATPKVVAPSVRRAEPKTTPPVAKADGAVKIRLYPKTLDALVFARKTVSAWTCPADDRSPFGPDGRPGTGDDACDPIVAQWSLENETAGRLNKRTGHKVLVQMVDMQQNRLIAKWQDQVRPALLTPLPRPADQPAPRLIWQGPTTD